MSLQPEGVNFQAVRVNLQAEDVIQIIRRFSRQEYTSQSIYNSVTACCLVLRIPLVIVYHILDIAA